MSNITQVITARVSNETANYVKENCGSNKSKFLEEIIKTYRESRMIEICFMYGINEENLLEGIRKMLENGELEVEDGEIKVSHEITAKRE